MKIKAVISRFGEEIHAGAERHAWDILQILPKAWDIEVYTTTAKDYITWKNHYPSGKTQINNIKIHRYPVVSTRNLKKFNRFSNYLMNQYPNQTLQEEKHWLELQGPYSPELVNAILSEAKREDVFLFFSYLYYPIVETIGKLGNQAILIPMLHDEFPAYFEMYKKAFNDDISYAFNSPEELQLFQCIFGYKPSHCRVIGTYVEDAEFLTYATSESMQRNPEFLFSIGRMDMGKGFYELIELYQDWLKTADRKLPLYIAGRNPPQYIKKFESEWIRFLGFVSDEEKNQYLKSAKFLINPSSMESFSIVLMEAWSKKTPVLVNGKSDVLKGHCLRSNGGLFYKDRDSFQASMDILVNDERLLTRMGTNGYQYFLKNFQKDIVQEKIINFLSDSFKRNHINS